MRKLDYNLPHTDLYNIETARILGLVWSEVDRMYINIDGSIPAGYEGEQDNPWGRMSKRDRIYAHK